MTRRTSESNRSLKGFRPAIAGAAGIAACVAALSHTTAVAQDAPAAGVLQEITVTARRREESIQDVPIAVTAITGDALDRTGATDIAELAQLVPSVTLEPSRATNSTLTAFIRGVGQQDPLAGFEQGVALYVDDVYIARPQGALLDIYDVERIEVLRGPQGTLYGRNAVGGAIKYVTRRLGADPELRTRATIGNYGQQDLVLTGTLPLSDSLRVGASVASLNRDGYGKNRTTGKGNYDKDVLAYRISAEFDPTDSLSVRVSYDKTDDQSAPVAGWRPFAGAVSKEPVLADKRDTLAGAAIRPSTKGINGNNQVESEGVKLALELRLSDTVTLRSITADRNDYSESVIDFDSLSVMDFDAPVKYDNEQFSQELQFLYGSDSWNAVIGAYYLDASAANDFDVVLGQIAGGITAYTGGTVGTKAWSAFGDVTYQINNSWAISAGGRYTNDERKADIFRANYLGLASPFFGATGAVRIAVGSDFEAKRTYTNFSPRVNLSYKASDNSNLYLSYSEGFKAGSFDPRGANFATPEVAKGFGPEYLDSYEAGLKSTWLDGRAITNVALFYSDYQDMQIPGSVAIDTNKDGINDSFVGTVTNAAKSTIKGIEVEGNLLLSEAWSIQFATSLLDAKIDEWLVNNVNVASLRKVQNTPESMAFVAINYTTDVSGGVLNASANASYRGSVVQFEVPNPLIDQGSVTLLNASLYWTSASGQLSLGLHGKNLTDEDVKTAGYCFGVASTGCPSALGIENNVSVFYGAPRTIAASIEYRFR
jgi:iron complex outermembrane receptor protein